MHGMEEELLRCRGALERYVRYRISNPTDAEDVLQEVYTAAMASRTPLHERTDLKAWLIGIARNKCADYFRRRYHCSEVPIAEAERIAVLPARFAPGRDNPVMDALQRLSAQDQQILRLCYWLELPQKEIAQRLDIPLGTVKSRLYHAREHFRTVYPHPPKGASPMRNIMPKILPDYTITPSKLPPFPCKWEELMGWFIVPRLGESLSWAMYDFPERVRTEEDHLTVTGRALVHGLEGVEIQIETSNPMENNQTGDDDCYVQRSLVAQLTDTHCRILSETHTQGGVKQMYTFLDGDDFLSNWGFGPDNCGNEIRLAPKGLITRRGNILITCGGKKELMDVVGRYNVTIGDKQYDTVCIIMHEAYMGGMASEQFIDQHGRTVLWRRFNADDWHMDRYGKTWSDMLPDSECLLINGKKYVHWYDCITSYIL